MLPVPPVDKIPHELLSKIFTFVSSDPNINPTYLITITHVCARWRQIALASGNVWLRIALIYPVTPRHMSYASTMLERSGAYPIDILLDLRDPAWDWDEDTHRFGWKEMEPLMRLFLVHIARWRTVELLTDTWAPVFTFLWYTKHAESAPLLEHISLSRCNAYLAATGQIFQPVSLRQPIQFFGGAKLERLKQVSLVGVHVDWSATSSLRNLSRLEFKYQAADVTPSLTEFQDIIAGCPSLLELSLYACGPRLDDSTNHLLEQGNIYLPHVKKLSIGFIDIAYTIRLLLLLVTPNLENLVLEDVSKAVNPTESLPNATTLLEWFSESNGQSVNQGTITPSLRLSNFPLHQVKTLELHCILASRHLLASFSRHFKSVSSLSLFEMEESIFKILIPPLENVAGDGPAFPTLSQLFCQDMDAELLIELVASRARSPCVPPLQNTSIEFLHDPPARASPIYDQLRKANIEIIGGDDEGHDKSMIR